MCAEDICRSEDFPKEAVISLLIAVALSLLLIFGARAVTKAEDEKGSGKSHAETQC
jgi:hypothetical protein